MSFDRGAGGGYDARTRGDVAQLGEHLLCKEGVRGSSPLISTTISARRVRYVLDPGRPKCYSNSALAGRPTTVLLAFVVTSPH